MHYPRKLVALVATGGLFLAGMPAAYAEQIDPSTSTDPILWYSQPASQTPLIPLLVANADAAATAEDHRWEQTTLPIGNGDIGGTIYGEIGEERIIFNEKTLWSGGPGNPMGYTFGNDASKGANGAAFRDVQRLFEENQPQRAVQIARNKLVGFKEGQSRKHQQGSYEAWGEVLINQGLDTTEVTNYRRDLNLKTGVATVNFDHNGAHYTREMFVSNEHDVMVVRVSTDKPEGLSLTAKFPTYNDLSRDHETITFANNIMTTAGKLSNNGLKYNSKMAVVADGAQVEHTNDALRVTGGSSATFYIHAATDFKYAYPDYRTGQSAEELDSQVAQVLNKALEAGWDTVQTSHVEDHSSLMGRVNLNVGWDNSLPTNELLNRYKAQSATPAQQRTLETLLYQYGRYMTVGSSREDSQLPANLQGVWARRHQDRHRAENAWKADYHLNVNLQMNYWPTYSGNLAELAEPMIKYMEGLVEPGRETAKIYFGTTGEAGTGFSAHTETTPYGWTAPGFNFNWGWSPAGVPWMLQNVYEAYEYSLDTDLLARVYPMMEETSNFYIDKILHPTTDATGAKRLASAPAYSPEHGPVTDGNTYEQTLIWQLFNDTIEAAEILGQSEKIGNTTQCSVDNWNRNWANAGAFVTPDANRTWACAFSLLKPIEIGTSGQIKEWYDEGEIGKWANGSNIGIGRGHRHMSHLLGLFPGDLITVDDPTYMEAAKVSLNERTDTATGWGTVQRMNAWARVGDGNRAHRIIKAFIGKVIYPNLFDTHAPFQIDGNFGYTAAVNEMLLQSNSTFTGLDNQKFANYMNILPALPDAWSTGSVSGLRARGNFTVGIDWSEGVVNHVNLTSHKGTTAALALQGARSAKVVNSSGEPVEVTVHDGSHLSFPTTAGESYTITVENSIKVESANGSLVIGKPQGTLQLVAEATDGTEDGPELVWSSNDDDVLTVDQTGLVTAMDVDGVANVKVAFKDDPRVSANVDIRVITGAAQEVNVDDNDPGIQYSSGWRDWRDPAGRNLGNLKWTQAPNQTIDYTFNGTGITVVGNLNTPLASLKVCVDNNEDTCQTVDLSQGNDLHRQDLATFSDLENGEHTVHVESVRSNNTWKVEFDYFKVMVPGVSRAALHDALDLYAKADLNPKTHIAETLEAVVAPHAEAVELLAADEANAEQIQAKAEALTTALQGVRRDEEKPTAPGNVSADPAEQRVILTWTASEDNIGVHHYEVTYGDDKTISVTDPTATIDGLTASTDYTFVVHAVDHAGNKSDAAEVATRTTAPVVVDPPNVDPQDPGTGGSEDPQAPPAPELTVSVSPVQPAVGAKFTVTIRGLKADGEVGVELQPVGQELAVGQATADGTFTFEATLPSDITPGEHSLVVIDLGHEREVAFPMTVVAATDPVPPTTGDGSQSEPSGSGDGSQSAPGKPEDTPQSAPGKPQVVPTPGSDNTGGSGNSDSGGDDGTPGAPPNETPGAPNDSTPGDNTQSADGAQSESGSGSAPGEVPSGDGSQSESGNGSAPGEVPSGDGSQSESGNGSAPGEAPSGDGSQSTPHTGQNEPPVKLSTSEVVPGGTITFAAPGFTPGETVTFEVHSTPVIAGVVKADARGVATLEWTVPADFEAGQHTVYAINSAGVKSAGVSFTVKGTAASSDDKTEQQSKDKNGQNSKDSTDKQQSTDVPGGTKQTKPKTGKSLASTGATVGAAALGALILAGAGVLMVRRRRS